MSAAPTGIDRIKQGDTYRRTGTWTSAGTPVNLTGYTLTAELRAGVGGALASAVTVTLSNQGTNPGEFTLLIANTSSIAAGSYVIDIRYETPGGDSLSTTTWQVMIDPPVTARP